MIGPMVKPRWVSSTSAVSLVANGGLGRVMFSVALITIKTRQDLSHAVDLVRGRGYCVEEFMECLSRAWLQRHGKSLDESL
jgi:hypothetical protein